MKPPRNVQMLEKALRAMSVDDQASVMLRKTLANIVAGQFLADAVMRGGGALKLRYGEDATRYTLDFDASRRVEEEVFAQNYAARLKNGWGPFSGRLVRNRKPRPADVPGEYVMRPFEVKLTYMNQAWCTVDLEVAYNEVGDAAEAELIPLSPGLLKCFSDLGLPEPEPVPLMRLAHQIAQKLHGATDPHCFRGQDIVDLQLIFAREKPDLSEIRDICERLFANRRRQSWPTPVAMSEELRLSYESNRGALSVLPTAQAAVIWVNDLIKKIVLAN